MPRRRRRWEEHPAVTKDLGKDKIIRARYGKEWFDAVVLDTRVKDEKVKIQWQSPFEKEDPQWLPITDCMVSVLVKSPRHEDDSSSTEEEDDLRSSDLISFIRSMRKNSRAEASVPERLRWAIANHVKPIKIKRLVKLCKRSGILDAAIDGEGSTVLHHACAAGNYEAIKLILAAGGVPHVPNGRGFTSLHFAASHGHTIAMNSLLEAGAKLEATNAHGRTPLHVAVLRGRVLEATFLLANGACIAATDAQDKTALHLAAQCGNADVIEMLISAEADLFATDRRGRIPMHAAAAAGHVAAIDRLCSAASCTREEAQRQVDARDAVGATPLHLVCESRKIEAVKHFVERLEKTHGSKVTLHVKDTDMLSPLHYALRIGSQAVVEYLLFVGIDTKVVDIMLAQGIANSTTFGSIRPFDDIPDGK